MEVRKDGVGGHEAHNGREFVHPHDNIVPPTCVIDSEKKQGFGYPGSAKLALR